MKKLLVILTTAILSLSISTSSNADNVAAGITVNFSELETSGSETLRDSGQVTTTSVTEDVVLPEAFIELQMDNGAAVGVSYIPVQELGSKSRTDTDIATATNKAAAELDDLFTLYLDFPVYDNLYIKGGVTHTTIVTTENLGTGSSYEDQDVFGYTVGLGYKGDLPYGDGMFFKAEALFTEFDSYNDVSANNKVTADTEAISLKASVGYRF